MDPDITERVQHVIATRQSSRAAFDPAWRVTDHELAHIIDAARWAPTAHGMQDVRLVVVDDANLLAALGRIRTPQPIAALIAGAPLVIVALHDPTLRAPEPGSEPAPEPASEIDRAGLIGLGCILENMWLAAHAEHLDVQVVTALASDAAQAEVRRVLGVPAPWRIAFAVRFGHALANAPSRRVRRPPDAVVGRNRF